jgi:type IV pilus assembly protein PilN
MKIINLLPPEIVEKRQTERRWVYFLALIIVFVVLFAFVFMITYGRELREKQTLSKIQAENDKLKNEIAMFQVFEQRKAQVQQREQVLAKAMAGEISWYKLLNEISMVIPSEVSLTSLSLDLTGGVKMTGSTQDYSAVAKWLVRLGEIKELKDVWLESAGKATEKGKETITFSMTANLAGSSASGQPAPSQ